MSIKEFSDLLDYIQKNHEFGGPSRTEAVKYVDGTYDSRDGGCMWLVTFRGWRSVQFSSDDVPKGFTHFSWIMSYLKGEWKP